MSSSRRAGRRGGELSADHPGESRQAPAPLAVVVVRAWGRLYTRGLPAAQRERRLAELESDLHEHLDFARSTRQAAADTDFEVLSRLLLGVPADLAWRWAINRGARHRSLLLGRMVNVGKRVLLGLGVAVSVVLGAHFVMNGVGILLGGGEGGEPLTPWGVIEIVGGLMLLAGPALASRQPRVGAMLVVVGALVIGSTHLWLAAVNIPVGAALIAAAVVRSRRIIARRAAATG